MAARKRKPAATAKAKPVPPRTRDHKRTPQTVRILELMLKANPDCTQDLLAEAIGVSTATLKTRYGDVIPHHGPGRPAHQPTAATRLMVEQHKALGLKHREIAFLLGINRETLEKHYGTELGAAKSRLVHTIGSVMVARALSKSDKDAQRAGEFLLERLGGMVQRTKLGVGLENPGGDEDDPALVGPQGPSRGDARKVALLFYRAAQQQSVVSNEPVVEAPAEPEAKR